MSTKRCKTTQKINFEISKLISATGKLELAVLLSPARKSTLPPSPLSAASNLATVAAALARWFCISTTQVWMRASGCPIRCKDPDPGHPAAIKEGQEDDRSSDMAGRRFGCRDAPVGLGSCRQFMAVIS